MQVTDEKKRPKIDASLRLIPPSMSWLIGLQLGKTKTKTFEENNIDHYKIISINRHWINKYPTNRVQ